MTRQLAKLFDTIWTLSMGLFLGLTAGLVLAVILAFKGTRALHAKPQVGPYDDPRFAAHYSDAVAGYIGQDLFMIGGTVALVLLGTALLAWIGGGLVLMTRLDSARGSKRVSQLRSLALVFVVLCMIKSASLTRDMNKAWPGLYDASASEAQITTRRTDFEAMHKRSEEIVGAAWLAGLLSLAISPWCQRLADTPAEPTPNYEQ